MGHSSHSLGCRTLSCAATPELAHFVAATILLIAFLTSTAAAAEPTSSEASVNATPGDEQVASNAIVSELRVAGNRAISTDRIVTSLKTAVGKPFDAAAMGVDTKKLMQTGFFQLGEDATRAATRRNGRSY